LGFFQSLYVVEFGVASIGQTPARPFAVIFRQGFVHGHHLAHAGTVAVDSDASNRAAFPGLNTSLMGMAVPKNRGSCYD
jgi:hypothetical protein